MESLTLVIEDRDTGFQFLFHNITETFRQERAAAKASNMLPADFYTFQLAKDLYPAHNRAFDKMDN